MAVMKFALMKFELGKDPLYREEFLPKSEPPKNVGPARLILQNTKWRQQAGNVAYGNTGCGVFKRGVQN
jgi:hypothetical protein